MTGLHQPKSEDSHNADQRGDGAIAQGQDSLAIGAEGIGLKGNVGGNVIIAQNGSTIHLGELKSPAPAQAAPALGEPPYMGLRYFDTGDAALFHGRAALTRELTERLAAGERFLAIVGASGSGKSSLARAGLVTAWQAGIDLPGGSLGVPVHVITPTSHPLVAGRKTLVFQHPLETISRRAVGFSPISGTLDTNPRQLAQKGSLLDRFTQFISPQYPNLSKKGRSHTLFLFVSLSSLCSKNQSRGGCIRSCLSRQ